MIAGRRLLAPIVALAAGLALQAGRGRSDEIDEVAAETAEIARKAELLKSHHLKGGGLKGEHYAEERLIDGENFYRVKDYQRASIYFMDIIENYPDHAAYPDALFGFADSLFMTGDYLGAREWFSRLLDIQDRTGAERFRERAIGRLIEIAIHLKDFEKVDEYLDQFANSTGAEARYVRGKYFYFKGDFERARQELSSVSGDPLLGLKAAYLIGAALTRQGRYDDAITVFLQGRQYAAKSPEEQEIVDLMNLGAGRLYYEKNFVENASACYQRVAPNSKYFDSALYEAASVLIQAGDAIRAERTLEVLTVALPDSKYLLRAKILRGNLLLRTGRYDEAKKLFEGMIDEFGPVLGEFNRVMENQKDTQQFFVDLVERSLFALNVTGELPPLVVKWVQEEPEVRHALDLADEVRALKEYVREIDRLVGLLDAVVNGPSRINAIPELKEAKRRVQQMGNRLTQLRVQLLKMEQDEIGRDPKIRELKAELAKLGKEVDNLPTSDARFEEREARARQVFDRMNKEIKRNEIRLDRMSAMAVALERFVADPKYAEGLPADSLRAARDEIGRQGRSIDALSAELFKLRADVERARYQVGVGDLGDAEDRDIREKVRVVAERERGLLKGGKGLDPRLAREKDAVDQVEMLLRELEVEVDKEADRRIQEIRRQVDAEKANFAVYRVEMIAIDDEAEKTIGGVAFENFSSVKSRFYDLVLKADVGIIDVAWLRKEEHGARITDLTKERLKQIGILDGEFSEVRSGQTGSEK